MGSQQLVHIVASTFVTLCQTIPVARSI